jgi:hypothetical protein
MWDYIRTKVRNAVLQGINDAMQELQGPATASQEPEPVALLLEYHAEEPVTRSGSRTRAATK